MKHIAFISHLSELSGAGISLLEKARAMQARGFRCTIVLPGKGPIEERIRAAGVPYIVLRNPQVSIRGAGRLAGLWVIFGRLLYVLRLRNWMTRSKVEIAYINTAVSVFPGFAARLVKARIAWQIHEALINPSLTTRKKMDYIEKHAHAIIYDSRLGQSLFPAPKIPVHLVHFNYVDVDACESIASIHETGDAMGVAAGEKVVTFNGPFRRKGGDIFIDAAVRVSKEYGSPVRFVILGAPEAADPGFAEQMKKAELEGGISGQVTWMGVQSNVTPILKRSDIFVSASRNEARPIIIAEAMACGIPVVATAVGDCRDMLNKGELGTLVPAENAVALAMAILDILNSPDAARDKAHLAQESIRREYSSDEFWKPLERLLAGL